MHAFKDHQICFEACSHRLIVWLARCGSRFHTLLSKRQTCHSRDLRWQALVGMALEQNLVAMVTKTGAQRTYSAITITDKVRGATHMPPPPPPSREETTGH